MSEHAVFRTSEIRRKMEVFTFDDVHLGTVLRIRKGREGSPGGELLPSVQQQGAIDGESLGPAPTQAMGNAGPITQSPRNHYATTPRHGDALGGGSMLIGHWYGLTGRRTISLDDVQTVALERIILRYPYSHYEEN